MGHGGAGAGVNCGFVYFQNVAPNGPVAAGLAEVMDRRLRWSEMSDRLIHKRMPTSISSSLT